jgi:hypothetical protein
MSSDRPWFVGLRKLTAFALTLASLTWLATAHVLDGAQFLGGLAGVVTAFFGVNYLNGKKPNG